MCCNTVKTTASNQMEKREKQWGLRTETERCGRLRDAEAVWKRASVGFAARALAGAGS